MCPFRGVRAVTWNAGHSNATRVERLIVFAMKVPIACFLLLSATCVAQEDNRSLETLIDQLAESKGEGFGYSSYFSGVAFLPRQDAPEVTTMVLGTPAPHASDTMRQIVRKGADAIPMLVRHLDDKRATAIEPISGMMWMAWDDEYDYNRRTRKSPPEGVNRESFQEGQHPTEHKVTVGDLCFVALGQIVNRSFNATRYQPTGGVVVSSPTYSKSLLAVVRSDHEHMDKAAHREQLRRDFLEPDHEFRRNGAVMRIAFYYPDMLDELVVRQLKAPTFNVFTVDDFARKVLYPESSPKKQKKLFDDYVARYGEPGREGLLLHVFNDLDNQIADEEGRMHPPMKPRLDARSVLVHHFSYNRDVKPQEVPYVNSWAESDLARFVEALGPVSSPVIRAEVRRVFLAIKENDYLALACMKVLKGQGNDDELIAYCERRVGVSKYEKEKLKEMLKELKNPSSGKDAARSVRKP